jgi:hypothetical protein
LNADPRLRGSKLHAYSQLKETVKMIDGGYRLGGKLHR